MLAEDTVPLQPSRSQACFSRQMPAPENKEWSAENNVAAKKLIEKQIWSLLSPHANAKKNHKPQ